MLVKRHHLFGKGDIKRPLTAIPAMTMMNSFYALYRAYSQTFSVSYLASFSVYVASPPHSITTSAFSSDDANCDAKFRQ